MNALTFLCTQLVNARRLWRRLSFCRSKQAANFRARENVMKKLILSALILGASVVMVPSIEAKTTSGMSAAADPQIRVQIGRNRRYNRWNRRYMRRTVVSTRIRRIGFRTYRETIRTTYMPNGMVRTTVIDRTRIRG